MQRYFVSCNNDNITVSNDDIFHITKVMRMKIGDEFEVNNDGDVYLCKVSGLNPFNFEIIKKYDEDHELRVYTRLLYCIPKGEKIDLVIQKATELGVNEIVLVNSSRCIAKITNENKSKKLERFNKIAKEASEQCKRTKLPIIENVIDYKDIVKFKSDMNLIAYENATSSLKDLRNKLDKFDGKSISILIGAEGGFSKEEVEYASNNDFEIITLGKRILRSETSVFYALSILGYHFDN
ncbi:MAG: 16S rRNA (uracil(1498)-N(3))-methyltransferase [Bacilli bacterium]|nr:16S rRNA (uracil(1498)-N(3))-methyltransferase [Bacilli bacterium]